jgi:hypothetical protein
MNIKTSLDYTVLYLKEVSSLANQGKRITRVFPGIFEGDILLGKEVIIYYDYSEGLTEVREKYQTGK